MTRYYCEYCHSYLTHDTLSVRKSHLVGKNHLRITADYYRNKARDIINKHNHKRRHIGKRGRKERENSSQNETLKVTCLSNKEKKTHHACEENEPKRTGTNLNRYLEIVIRWLTRIFQSICGC